MSDRHRQLIETQKILLRKQMLESGEKQYIFN